MPRQITFIMLGLLLCASVVCAEDKKERTRTTKFEMEAGKLKLPGAIEFDTGSDKLKAESEEALWVIADYLEAKKDITLLRIEGHTDSTGKPDVNQTLSEKRALAVAHWLVAHKVDCKRLIAVGFGASKPVESNDTPAGKAANRRIDVRPAGMRGKLIGGQAADGGGKVAGDVCEKSK
jgi:OOP family OmpA-OmpF porin